MDNKKREWVKTAAIIFLTIMLLLTFFSNTIMNYSLPEVSAKYVQSGSLSEQIRGTVTVEAAQQYEVKYNGASRTIDSVEVKQGDTVEKGQVLLRFNGEIPDLEPAEKELETARNDYRSKLLDLGADYSLEELEIKNLEEDIERLKASLGGNNDYSKEAEKQKELEEMILSLTKECSGLEKEKKDYENKLTSITEQLSSLGSDDYDALDNVYSNELSPIYTSVVNYKGKKEKYEKEVEQYTKELGDMVTNEDIAQKNAEVQKLQAQAASLEDQYFWALIDETKGDASSINESLILTKIDLGRARSELYEMYNKQTTDNLINLKLQVSTRNQLQFENKYNDAQNTLNLKKLEVSKKINSEKKKLKAKLETNVSKIDEIKSNIETAEADKKKVESEIETIKKKIETDNETKQKITENERSLETMKINLEKKQNEDLVAAGKTNIEIEAMQSEIKRLEGNIQKLKNNAQGGEITAPVAGIISSMKVVPGETLESGTSAASIEMVEKGYTASFSVTLDQAKKVKIGDMAEIQYFWGGDAQAKLTQIKADPSNAQNKQLVFDVSGDVTPGQSLQLVLGGKGQPYECIIPNNAIKEDSNGKFVLTVIAKSSPLGNRYIAKRCDITVIASDGVNTAVTGVAQSDFIISTSTKPINAGDQVRLVEG
ncbi:MAG: HlyD family efflux transporter periplasmic adaptor subunit [Oscillospiraceae bacterium]